MKKFLSLILFAFLLSSCAPTSSVSVYSGQNKINQILPVDFSVQKFYTDTFTLYGLFRPARNNSVDLHVYIEGDGLAWLSRTVISENPTPTDNTTAMLARNDTSDAAVLYLARPCQYVEAHEMQMCSQEYWTSHRLAPEVISALDTAISQAKENTRAEDISLVGYSGGGGAAVLVAARRDDVDFLGTVAGLLDHETWTDMHNITPLYGSLNPLDSIDSVKNIEQLHITGLDDDIITYGVNDKFCNELASNSCEEIYGFTHNDDWYMVWDYERMNQY